MTTLPQNAVEAEAQGYDVQEYDHECRKAEAILKHRWVHQAVRNVLINEVGISKDGIAKVIDERIGEAVRKEVNNRFPSLDRLVSDEIARILGEPKLHSRLTSGDPFQDYIKKEIRRQVEDAVMKRLSINLSCNYTGEDVNRPVKDSDRVTYQF